MGRLCPGHCQAEKIQFWVQFLCFSSGVLFGCGGLWKVKTLPGRRWAESCMLALSGTCYSDYAPDKISLTINSALVPWSLPTSESQMSRERMNTRVHAQWTQALNRAHCCKQRPIWEEAFLGGGQKDTFHLSPLA